MLAESALPSATWETPELSRETLGWDPEDEIFPQFVFIHCMQQAFLECLQHARHCPGSRALHLTHFPGAES